MVSFIVPEYLFSTAITFWKDDSFRCQYGPGRLIWPAAWNAGAEHYRGTYPPVQPDLMSDIHSFHLYTTIFIPKRSIYLSQYCLYDSLSLSIRSVVPHLEAVQRPALILQRHDRNSPLSSRLPKGYGRRCGISKWSRMEALRENRLGNRLWHKSITILSLKRPSKNHYCIQNMALKLIDINHILYISCILQRPHKQRCYFRYFFNFLAMTCISIGFAKWSFIPHSKHFWISSEKASAVIAIMGISASARSSPRITLVDRKSVV